MVLFEPDAGTPVSDQGTLHDLFTAPRRLVRSVLLWLTVLIGVIGLVLPGHPVGFAVPVVVTAVGLIILALNVKSHVFLSSAEFAALAGSPTRQVVLGDGDLRQAGRTVGLRLPDEDRWVVGRLPAADRMMLARLRRVWVFGPSPGGRIGLLVPGGSRPLVARLAPAPPAGAQPVSTTPAEPPAQPGQDPAVRLALRQRLVLVLLSAAFDVAVIGLLTVNALVVRPGEPLFGNVSWLVPAAMFAALLLQNLTGVGRLLRAGRSQRWTWTRVTVGPLNVVDPSRLRLRLRVDAPHEEISLMLVGASALALAVHVSEQLWIMGDLRSSGRMFVGIPGVPAMGQVLARKRPL